MTIQRETGEYLSLIHIYGAAAYLVGKTAASIDALVDCVPIRSGHRSTRRRNRGCRILRERDARHQK